MVKPLVSVLMPVFNSAQYLRAAIDSIIEQTYSNLEFIIINDASTDYSLSILEEYNEIDNRIIVINSVANSGIGASLNKGIKVARGELLLV